MANGPKCADVAQKYILQRMRDIEPADSYSEITNPDREYDGEEEWSIGSVFANENLRQFEDTGDDFDQAKELFERLDEVYDAIKDTGTYNKLEGLEAFTSYGESEFPTDNRKTRQNWIESYRDAGLIDYIPRKSESKPQNQGTITELGDVFIKTTDLLNNGVFESLDMDAEEFYGKMVTDAYGGDEGNTGEKIEAIFLYGGGMGHTEISRELDVPESTVREMAVDFEEAGLFTENYMFTQEGRDLAEFVLCHLDDVTPEEFEEGTIETEMGQEEEDFFDDDGMLDL